jgi:hypothetical protein
MIKDRLGKTAWHMTVTTIVGRRNMIGMLADCRNTVMARSTVAVYAGMIENGAGKTVCIMTNAAIFAGGDMCRRLRKGANCIVRTIVARGTIRRDAGMIERRRIECRIGVASIAVLVCWHMY